LTGRLTVITSSTSQLGKTFALTPQGLKKTTQGELTKATYEVKAIATVPDLAALLAEMRTDQALMASLPKDGSTSGKIVTKAAAKDNPAALTRTKDCFGFPSSSGALVLDYDPPALGVALTRDELWRLVLTACPALAGAGVLWWSSASSHIFSGPTELQGLRGQRLYILCLDLSDTERFSSVLAKRLWLLGNGRIEVSKSGSKLVRSTFDLAMAESARLDYCGGAVVVPPLTQERGAPVALASGGFLDSRAALEDLTADEDRRYASLVADAKEAAEPLARATREAWTQARHGAEVSRLVVLGVAPQQAQERAAKTLSSALAGVLMGDFSVTLAGGATVTVADMMGARDKFERAECRDPLEPDYQGGKVCARVFLYGATATLHSFAHGGRTFKLRRQPGRIYVTTGRSAELTDDLLHFLEGEADIFLAGNSAAVVNGGDVRNLDRAGLAHLLGTRAAFYRKGKDHDIPTDPPREAIEMLQSIIPTQMKARHLKALALLPYARPDGGLIVSPGYDERSGVYAHFDADALPGPIPGTPTPTQTVAALRTLFSPWAAFRFASAEDRGAMLAAVVTAVVRPALELAPGFFFDAPVQASGKTRAASALGALMRGRRSGVTAFVGGQGAEAEWNKLVGAMLRAGELFTCVDNVTGHWSSSVLSGLITSGVFEGRVLGASVQYRCEARLMITATGNNASLDADLGRRLVRVRIDPACERPQSRDFAWCPIDRALSERLAIAHAVLVLIRAYFAAGAPIIGRGSAGFEQWSALVRQPVMWAGEMGYTVAAGIGDVKDSATSITMGSVSTDPDIEAWAGVLRGLHSHKNGERFTARQVHDLYQHAEHAPDLGESMVREGIDSLLGDRKQPSVVRIGHMLKNRRDRITGGLVLRHAGTDPANSTLWLIEMGG
jgi:hypothetical protein